MAFGDPDAEGNGNGGGSGNGNGNGGEGDSGGGPGGRDNQGGQQAGSGSGGRGGDGGSNMAGPGPGGGGERGRPGGRYGGGGNQAGNQGGNEGGGDQEKEKEVKTVTLHPDMIHGLVPGDDPGKREAGGITNDPGYDVDARNKEVADALAAAKAGPSAMDKLISALIALVIPGGMALRAAGGLPTADDIMQGRVDNMLGISDNTHTGEGTGNEGEGAGNEDKSGAEQEQQKTPAETEVNPASLLTLLQDGGTRGYLDQIRRQNVGVAERAYNADPGAPSDAMDLYAAFMEEGRARNLAIIDTVIGADYGRLG